MMKTWHKSHQNKIFYDRNTDFLSENNYKNLLFDLRKISKYILGKYAIPY